jgi:hypothetical protein
MAIKEQTRIAQVVAELDSGRVFVVTVNEIVKDGEVIASTPHRRPIEPDADLKGEEPVVQAIAKAARKS